MINRLELSIWVEYLVGPKWKSNKGNRELKNLEWDMKEVDEIKGKGHDTNAKKFGPRNSR